jgi:hypothetical protein
MLLLAAILYQLCLGRFIELCLGCHANQQKRRNEKRRLLNCGMLESLVAIIEILL